MTGPARWGSRLGLSGYRQPSSPMVKRERDLISSSFYIDIDLSGGPHPHYLIISQMSSQWGLRLQYVDFGGTQHFVQNTPIKTE